MVKQIMCSFFKRCKNANTLCHECKWNGENEFKDHLLIVDEDGKTLKFL